VQWLCLIIHSGSLHTLAVVTNELPAARSVEPQRKVRGARIAACAET
jgi:hypothetical protein